MIAVDTNVLVRLLINDPDSQAQVGLAKALQTPLRLGGNVKEITLLFYPLTPTLSQRA
jgi:predicted nucleic acid-binding protein